MKFHFNILSFCLLLTHLQTAGQSFTLKTASNVIVSNGDTVSVSGDVNGPDLTATLQLTNNATTSKVVMIERTLLSLVNGCDNAFAFGLMMYPPSINITPTGFPVDGGITDSSFWTSYWHNGIAGTSYIRYNFFDEANVNDSISVVFKFEITQATGLNTVSQSKEISIFPTITQDYIFIESDVPAKYTIINATGEIIQKMEFGKTQAKLNMIPFSDGVYFIVVESARLPEQKIFKVIKQK
ncbi:MAG: T9SS type A sorting domain-containing protein [Bacteroidetes bacterium]|nr:T9SS type A sorting domain-containing protein [Bacteroidota bacterium]